MRKVTRLSLLLASLVLVLACLLTVKSAYRVPTEDYAVRVDAAERLKGCMEQVKAYKAELGIPLSDEDRHETGMLGEDYTPITTTIGAPDAKRTTANPDMAALCVQLLEEAVLEQRGEKALRLTGERNAHALSPRKGARGSRRGRWARPQRQWRRCARRRAARRRPG